ncbi:uncharacterized protein J7T54_000009 [Emericellopsis cladophorae]|uniref:DUF8035 domain-containing protein n=1 Tax=Emericellopsis cladophorae TaxID=2686198 RepID=A0A9P9XVH2_9HYPO|nr:uncharacterized protein J7T54_000009 [Emericellopsis cladophorae]KAI6778200.1 hypothetical protein J7T54_000009 [Emericellopsis cladophorae]
MADRYHGGYAPNSRSQTFNPARSSMPSSVGYSSHYAGDMHVLPSSTNRQPVTTPRGYVTTTSTGGVPTTTRTYAVSRSGVPTSRDTGRARRSTLDSNSRPPVIITTKQSEVPQASTHTAHYSSHSPVRHSGHTGHGGHSGHSSRVSEGHLSALPASSATRSRSTAPYHRHHESEDFTSSRDRERLEAPNADAYRSSRPTVLYPSEARQGSSATPVDYGDDGYQYTNAGELARYDLDHSRPASRHRRRESVDRGYYRPNVNYNSDSRSFNVNTSADLSRNYSMNTSRPYESSSSTRGGPPPSTRGFDKINSGFESAPPVAPVPPSPIIRQTEGGGDSKRGRPVSLYQDREPPRSSHHDDYYRSREDERNMRELRDRDRESERVHQSPKFQDDSITTRGFGIRTGPVDGLDDRRRREPWREEPRKRSDEEIGAEIDPRRRSRLEEREEPRKRSDESLQRDSDVDRRRRNRMDEREEPRRRSDESLHRDSDADRRRRNRVEEKPEPRERRGSDDERSRIRDKITSGVGVAAAAVGLGPLLKGDEKEKGKDVPEKEPRRRRSPTIERERHEEYDRSPRVEDHERFADRPRDRVQEPEPEHEREYERERERERDRERDRDRTRDRERQGGHREEELKDQHRRDAEGKLAGEAAASGSDSDAVKRSARRNRASQSFNPNDAGDISKLREQLATMDTSDRPRGDTSANEKPKETEPRPATAETSRTSRPSRPTSPAPRHSESTDESRGREVALVNSEEKAVRVVSPPREKGEGKPLKGILKQPRPKFPEEQNFVREGAAPHKDDKKAKDVPPGAKWTKISRKVVNPEALTVGKERFEVRDDFVIVLRVLDKEEIQAYAAATQVLRERRRGRETNDEDAERSEDPDREDDDRRRRRRRHVDEDKYEPEDRDRNRDRDSDRRRRHRDEDEDEYSRRPADHRYG